MDVGRLAVCGRIIPRLIAECIAGALIVGLTRDRAVRFARNLVDQAYRDSTADGGISGGRVGFLPPAQFVDQVWRELEGDKPGGRLERLQAEHHAGEFGEVGPLDGAS